MPVMNGREAARRIKALPEGQETIVVALTASAFEEERVQVLAEGCDDFVRKPFGEATIVEVLHKHLGARFVYEEPGAGDREPHKWELPPDFSLVSALSALPPALLGDLERATVQTDMLRIERLITRIRDYDMTLADVLATLADEFEYGKILTSLKTAMSVHSDTLGGTY